MMRLILRLSLFFIVIGLCIYSTWLSLVLIHKVVVVGTDADTSAQIQAMTETTLNGSYLGLIPKHNALFYPKQSLSQAILALEPRIKTVTLNTEGFEVLNVKVEERMPTATWCNDSGCYLIDEDSYIYEKTASSSVPTANLITFYGGSLWNNNKPISGYAFDKKLFGEIGDISTALASSSLAVDSIHFKDIDNIEFKIKGNGSIMVSGRRPFDESMSTIASALKSSIFSSSSQFAYIDVRFGNKVFYRLKNALLTSGTISTTTATGTATSTRATTTSKATTSTTTVKRKI